MITEEVPDLETATRIASSGFVQPISDELRQDVAGHMAGGDVVYGIQEDGQFVGFVIFNIWDDILYLSGIIIHQDYQRHRHVVESVTKVRRQHLQLKYLALRTQSLRMYVAGRKVCSTWLPRVSETTSSELVRVGKEVAERTNSVFPLHVGCYGGPLYGEKPVYHDEPLQRWWDELCSFEQGDAAICVGELLREYPVPHSGPPQFDAVAPMPPLPDWCP